MSEPVATCRQVGRQFGAQPPVLSGVDLDLYAGQVLGLIGPNGGGKSTLLLLLAGLLRPSHGEVRVTGLPADTVAQQAQGTVGLLTAEPGLYPLLTGRENLHFFGELYGLSASEVDRRAGPLLAELGVGDHLDRPASAYSSGMKQKVSLARALLLDPKLLLLDEPTSNLDPLSSHTLHQAMARQAERGVAVVLCTHDLGAAEQICHRVAVIAGGVRHVETLERRPARADTSRLLDLYRTYAGEGP